VVAHHPHQRAHQGECHEIGPDQNRNPHDPTPQVLP
jgi:hypothetical protein